jgi:hypothetical protein
VSGRQKEAANLSGRKPARRSVQPVEISLTSAVKGRCVISALGASARQNRPVASQLSLTFAGSTRYWLNLRMSTNPLKACGGPVPQISIPLEARAPESDIQLDVLRLMFDLKLGDVLVGQGEIGPLTNIRTSDRHFSATATCPWTSVPYLLNPPPPQGRLTLKLGIGGMLRYRHSYKQGDIRAQGLGEPDVWHIEPIGEPGAHELEVQVARSDWYEQVVAKLGLGSYLVAALPLPVGVATWQAALGHLDAAGRALTQADPPAVFGHCRAALDALPGAKTRIFDAMPDGKKREAIDELTKRIGAYLHSGRHVEPNTGGQQAGEFPVDQRDAAFAYNMTKLLLSQIYGLILAP